MNDCIAASTFVIFKNKMSTVLILNQKSKQLLYLKRCGCKQPSLGVFVHDQSVNYFSCPFQFQFCNGHILNHRLQHPLSVSHVWDGNDSPRCEKPDPPSPEFESQLLANEKFWWGRGEGACWSAVLSNWLQKELTFVWTGSANCRNALGMLASFIYCTGNILSKMFDR